jgi:hypothetical protein
LEDKTKKILLISGISLVSVVAIFFVYKLIKRKMSVVYVSGEFVGKNCDEFHAFQGTNGRVIGGMNDKITIELNRLHKEGINPQVTEVDVVMDSATMKVKWKVKIEPSKDGKAWVGFTSRGSGGDKSAFTRAISKSTKQDFDSVKKKIIDVLNEPKLEMKAIKDLQYNFSKDGKVLGKCPTRQIFYVYTKPSKFPNN